MVGFKIYCKFISPFSCVILLNVVLYMIENETREFKKTTGEINEGVVFIVSILNKHKNGELYFGIKNDGTPFKLEITDSSLRDI